MGSMTTCVFCAYSSDLSKPNIIAQNDHAIVVPDTFPLNAGHCLVIPKRHVESFFEASASEKLAMLELIDRARRYIDNQYQPDAYNIGINDGPAAGQTIPHLHIHVIPRYIGDSNDPRGGIRWVLPDKAAYWKDDD